MQTTERINRIKNWIIDYCKNMPIEAKTLVIGVSGGIDSSVTSTLCLDWRQDKTIRWRTR